MTRFSICTLRQGRKDHVIYYTPCVVVIRVGKLCPKEGTSEQNRARDNEQILGGGRDIQCRQKEGERKRN